MNRLLNAAPGRTLLDVIVWRLFFPPSILDVPWARWSRDRILWIRGFTILICTRVFRKSFHLSTFKWRSLCRSSLSETSRILAMSTLWFLSIFVWQLHSRWADRKSWCFEVFVHRTRDSLPLGSKCQFRLHWSALISWSWCNFLITKELTESSNRPGIEDMTFFQSNCESSYPTSLNERWRHYDSVARATRLLVTKYPVVVPLTTGNEVTIISRHQSKFSNQDRLSIQRIERVTVHSVSTDESSPCLWRERRELSLSLEKFFWNCMSVRARRDVVSIWRGGLRGIISKARDAVHIHSIRLLLEVVSGSRVKSC